MEILLVALKEEGRFATRQLRISKQYPTILYELLSNVTKRGLLKLLPLDLIDVRFGRSTFIHSQSFHYYFALLMNMNHYFFHKVQLHRV